MNKAELIKSIILLSILSIAAFIAGISFEQNSIIQFFNVDDCYQKAAVLESYTYADLTNDLRNKECNEINWLWDKTFYQED